MMRVQTLVYGILLVTCVASSQEQSKLPLSSLKAECKLEQWWVGAIPGNPWGAWLKCRKEWFLVTHPLNLLGKVEIQTAEQALEYVRFFTNSTSSDLFRLGGMVEVFPGKTDGASDFNVMKPNEFYKHFEEASVKDLSPGDLRFMPESDAEKVLRGKEFEISRVVIFPDNHIYRVVENVLQDGWYYIVSKELLFEDARQVGLDYFP